MTALLKIKGEGEREGGKIKGEGERWGGKIKGEGEREGGTHPISLVDSPSTHHTLRIVAYLPLNFVVNHCSFSAKKKWSECSLPK